jgi:hypothetical protein
MYMQPMASRVASLAAPSLAAPPPPSAWWRDGDRPSAGPPLSSPPLLLLPRGPLRQTASFSALPPPADSPAGAAAALSTSALAVAVAKACGGRVVASRPCSSSVREQWPPADANELLKCYKHTDTATRAH